MLTPKLFEEIRDVSQPNKCQNGTSVNLRSLALILTLVFKNFQNSFLKNNILHLNQNNLLSLF